MTSFVDDYSDIAQNQQVKKGSSIDQLNPFIDNCTGILHARGRLEN